MMLADLPRQEGQGTEPPLRICLVVSHFFPHQSGAERQALEQGAELVCRGHRVHVVTKSAPGLPRDELVRGIHVHRWVDTAGAGPLFGLRFLEGVARSLFRLRSDLDVIHTHQALWEAVATGLCRLWMPDLPTLVQPASSGYYGEAQELMRTKGRIVLRRLILRNTHFAAISSAIEREWSELGVPPGKLSRMASGVDTNRFHPGPSLVKCDLPAGPRVVFTGRLHPQKNLAPLIDAWPEVVRRTRATLVLVGDGVQREQLREQSKRLGVSDHVYFAGSVADPSEYLRAADIFILPSIAEGLSNSLLEAMATGLPCIATAIGGNLDLIDEDQQGRLLPVERPEAWPVIISDLLKDQGTRQRLGRAALDRVSAKFALPVVVDRYVELYRHLTRARPKSMKHA